MFFIMNEMQIVNELGPSTGNAAAAAVGGKIYVHGGIKKRNDFHPLAVVQCYNVEVDHWTNIQCSKCPSLSHHSCFVTDDRFINFVGGYDGKSRTHDVHVFDAHHEIWLDHCPAENFPTGAGLSSHSVAPLVSGDALIVGRLGGLRTQRKSSSVLLCHRLDQTRFRYSELPLHAASRSGHTCNATSSQSVTLIGGREGKDGSATETVLGSHPLVPEGQMDCGSRLTLKFNANWPCRKYHGAVLLNDDRMLIFGGEQCGGSMNADPLNDCWVFSVKDSKWYQCLNVSLPKLSGHKICQLAQKWFVFGGFTDKWRPNNILYELRI